MGLGKRCPRELVQRRMAGFCRPYGKTIQNWAYQDFHHPDYMAEAVRKRFEATNAGKIWEDVFPLLGRDKKFHWLLSRAVPILNEEGKIECYFGFHMDVSDKIKHPPLRPAKW